MTRSIWKGKYISGDFCQLINHFDYIPLTKLNIYAFTHFKNLNFSLLRIYTFISWKLYKKYLGFTIGVFFFNREREVFHKLKKTKKQKEQEQRSKKKNKIIRVKKKGDILLAKKKKKKLKIKTKVHIKLLKSLKQRFH